MSLQDGLKAIGADADALRQERIRYLDALLDSRGFDINDPPPKPVPVLSIAGQSIATAGNLVVVQAQAKAGKTAILAAMMASLMDPRGDCLGVVGVNPDELPVIHVDTEQSKYDYFRVIAQALKRAGRQDKPDWFFTRRMKGVSVRDLVDSLEREMERKAINGKLRAAFLDGVGDMVNDPNFTPEVMPLITKLHDLAETYDCPIVCILHENPGENTSGKTRGHLGSQLERKAETNLRLTKSSDDGVTVVFTERSRNCHIPKEAGPRFVWDSEAEMHVSCGTARDEKTSDDDFHLRALAEEIFSERGVLRYSEALAAIMKIKGVKDKTAEKTLKKMVPGYIRKTPIGYQKA